MRTPAPEPVVEPAASDAARLYPVHVSFLDSNLVAHGEDPSQWRIAQAVETRLDEQGMEVLFTLSQRHPGRGTIRRRILVASGELVGVTVS